MRRGTNKVQKKVIKEIIELLRELRDSKSIDSIPNFLYIQEKISSIPELDSEESLELQALIAEIWDLVCNL